MVGLVEARGAIGGKEARLRASRRELAKGPRPSIAGAASGTPLLRGSEPDRARGVVPGHPDVQRRRTPAEQDPALPTSPPVCADRRSVVMEPGPRSFGSEGRRQSSRLAPPWSSLAAPRAAPSGLAEREAEGLASSAGLEHGVGDGPRPPSRAGRRGCVGAGGRRAPLAVGLDLSGHRSSRAWSACRLWHGGRRARGGQPAAVHGESRSEGSPMA